MLMMNFNIMLMFEGSKPLLFQISTIMKAMLTIHRRRIQLGDFTHLAEAKGDNYYMTLQFRPGPVRADTLVLASLERVPLVLPVLTVADLGPAPQRAQRPPDCVR